MKWVAALLLFAAGPLIADEEARQWLEDMSAALRTLNYDGTFVYLHDDKLEAMRIIHQADGGVEEERLVSLTGSPLDEVRVGYDILKSLELRQRGPVITSCPTCGRTEVDLVSLANLVEQRLADARQAGRMDTLPQRTQTGRTQPARTGPRGGLPP